MKHIFGVYILCAVAFASCDSGDIWPEQKIVEETTVDIRADFRFENADAFPVNHRVVWAAFVGTSPYPLAFEVAQKPASGTWNATTLKTVPRGTTHMALALVDATTDKAEFVFRSFPLSATGAMSLSETIDLATFERVQAQIFTPQCIQCHGAGGLAAGLDLTDGNARANLVGVPSQADNSPKNRVTPHSLTNSFLFDVLTSRPATVTTNHTTLSTLDAEDDIALVRAWIMSDNE
jgi:hypothetical protein